MLAQVGAAVGAEEVERHGEERGQTGERQPTEERERARTTRTTQAEPTQARAGPPVNATLPRTAEQRGSSTVNGKGITWGSDPSTPQGTRPTAVPSRETPLDPVADEDPRRLRGGRRAALPAGVDPRLRDPPGRPLADRAPPVL